MIAPRQTLELCEQLILKEIESTVSSSSTLSIEGRTITFSSSNVTFDQLKDLYKHLDVIQQLKNNYISER